MEANNRGWLLCRFRGRNLRKCNASIGLLAFETRSSIGWVVAPRVSSNYARGRELIVAHIRAPASPTSATSIEQRFMVLRHFEQHGFKMARDN